MPSVYVNFEMLSNYSEDHNLTELALNMQTDWLHF